MNHRESGSPVNPLAEAAQQFESRLIVVERDLPLRAAPRKLLCSTSVARWSERSCGIVMVTGTS